MVSRALTQIQKEILRFIESELAQEGSPPTLRAICEHFGFRAIGTVQDHLRALIQKGYLEKEPGKARGIKLSKQRWAASANVPIFGTVPAGSPQEAFEENLGAVPFPSHLAQKGELFALRVSGESMRDAGIHDGDLVIARKELDPKHGEIVVALVEGQVTVKRLEKQRGSVRLLPENPDFEPIEVRSNEDCIQGKVISVQRYYE